MFNGGVWEWKQPGSYVDVLSLRGNGRGKRLRYTTKGKSCADFALCTPLRLLDLKHAESNESWMH